MVHELKASQFHTWMTMRKLELLEIVSNSSNPTYQVDINSCIVGADDGTMLMGVDIPITVDITASGANGLDTGSEAANTWYYIWLIYNPATDTTAGLFSTSSTSPTLPSGYTKKRLIGAVRNDNSSDLLNFIQNNYVVSYNGTQVALFNGSATGWTNINLDNYVPTSKAARSFLHLASLPNSSDASVQSSSVGWDGSHPFFLCYSFQLDYAGPPATTTLFYNATQSALPVRDASDPDFYYRNSSSNIRCHVYVQGFELTL